MMSGFRSGLGKRSVAVLAVAVLGLAAPAWAAVRYVDAAVSGGAADGSSWANAHNTVAAALTAATSGDDLWVARGTYAAASTLQLKPGVNLYGGFSNTMSVITARDWIAHPALLSGSGIRRVLIGTNNTVLDGFVVTNGLVSGQLGGGLLLSGSAMTINNCLFVNNIASGGTGYGGALAQTGAGSATTISNCTFRDNNAAYGGAVHWAAGSTTVRDSRFINNSATGGGGALYPLGLSGSIADSLFLGNTAASAGGGAVYSGSRANCVAAFQRCVFANNFAGGGSGFGGAFIGADAYTIEDCSFSANRTASWAGALFGADNSTVVRRCVFAGNEAPNGGGASYYQGTGVFPSYDNCLFAGNFTPGAGGAMYLYSNARYDLRHSTFAGNRANGQGGAIYHIGGTVFFGITNCVFWTNSAGGAGAQIYPNQPGVVGVSYSDVQGGWSGPGIQNLSADPQFTGGPSGTWTAVGPFLAGSAQTLLTQTGAGWAVNAYRGLTANPDVSQILQFMIASNSTDTLYVWGNALTNNTSAAIAQVGDTFQINNYRPHILSPVIDAGVNVGVTDDLIGLARPLNDGFEMGAYEVPVPTVTTTLNSSPAGLAIEADLTTAAAPRVFSWKTNSVHTIAVTSPQAGVAGTRYQFSAWSDGGAQSHSVTALVNGTTLTAAFTTQMLWTTTVEPVASAGAITPAGGTWYELNTVITASAVAASGWVFTNWAGTVSGTSPQVSVTLNQPRHGIAQFAPTGTVVRVYSAPFGRNIEVDGTTWITNMFSWQPGEVHTLCVVATQDVGSVRYVFTGWENGSVATQRVFTTGAIHTNLIAQFKTQYALTWTVQPQAGLGFVLPPSGTFVDAGSVAGVTAVPLADVPFGRWTGAASGANTNANVLMNAPKQVVAHFYHGPAGNVIYVNDDAAGGNTGANWYDARVDLAQALAQAISGDEIWVARGTYVGGVAFLMKAGVSMYGGFGGWEGSTGARNWNAYPALLDGQGVRRVVIATNNAALDGFIVTNGFNAGNGGGMIIDNVSPTIRNCTFANNNASAGNSGGAISQQGTISLATISNCVFRDNTATYGGAIHWVSGAIAMRDSHFYRNRGTDGGGVAYAASVSGLVERCTFAGNTAGSTYGGGVYLTLARLSCFITNRSCVFTGNTSTGTGGANTEGNSFTYEDCIFSGNRAASYGGATFSADSAVVYKRTRFAGNESAHPSYGGSAMFYQGSTGIPVFENCIIAGNESVGPGGALNAFSTAAYSIRHTTIAANRTTASGGALATGNGAVQVVDSILWNNSAGVSGPEIFEATPGSISVLYSDVRGGQTGTGNINADPQFEGGIGGVWTGVSDYDATRGQTALTDANTTWAFGLLAGRFLNPNTNQYLQFVIASNSAHTVYVWGNAVSNRAVQAVGTNGAAYAIAGYQQKNGSPVIDAGVDFGVTEDIRRTARPQPVAGGFDMGAYEGGAEHVVAFVAPSSVAGEGASAVEIPVQINNWLHDGTGTVQVAVSGGTAAQGVDFNFTPGTLNFDSAHGGYLLAVTILPNGLSDGPRTVVLSLSNPTNVTLGPIATHTLTILDDDGPVSVAFDSAASSGVESVTPVLLSVSLNHAHGLPVSVSFGVTGGSATPGVDYGLAPGTLAFAVGETNKTIALKVLKGPEPESPETVTIGLHTPGNASLGANSSHTFTILDDDQKFVNIAATGANNGTSWADAFVSLSTALAHADAQDEVWVAQGTYKPAGPGESTTNRFPIRAGIKVYGGFQDGMANLSQRDPYKYPCILSGDLNGDDAPGFSNRGDNVATVVYVRGATGLVFDGFTVRGGYGSNSGAGLYLDQSGSFLVTRCTFTDNYIIATGLGAGMWCDLGSTGTVRNCLFNNNFSGFRAAGFGMDGFLSPYASVLLLNCTVTGNDASGEGDGVYARADNVPILTIRNCIIWENGNEDQNVRERGNTQVNISYSDYDRTLSSGDGIVDNGGQLTTDPLFADAVGGDFHLQSTEGRWTPTGVVRDAFDSPCIDAGDPSDPCNEEPDSDPCRIDMGAYGGSIQAAGSDGLLPATGLIIYVK